MGTQKTKKEIMAIQFTKDFARGIGADDVPKWYIEACKGDFIFLNPDEDTFEIKIGYDEENTPVLVRGGIGDWIVRCPKTGKINAIAEEGMKMFSDAGKTVLPLGDTIEEGQAHID